MSAQICGILNLNKPPGWTSRDAVNVVQNLVRPAKAGHAGTLDPLATGVLVVAIGRATRLIEYAQRGTKRYLAEFQLGQSSETLDIEAELIPLQDPPMPDRQEIEAALPQFRGEIQQRPPAFSALKVRGKRAYDLARAGEEVELPARAVRIYELRVVDYAYPQLTLEMACGSGTYVRSLGRDLAKGLGTEAVMSALTRTSVGPFSLGEGLSPEGITLPQIMASLRPPLDAVRDLPVWEFSAQEILRLGQGKRVTAPADVLPRQEYIVLSEDGQLLGIIHSQRGQWKIVRNIALVT